MSLSTFALLQTNSNCINICSMTYYMERAQCKNHKMHCKTSKVSNLFGMPGETSPAKNQQTVLAPLKIIQYIHKILRADQIIVSIDSVLFGFK